MIYEYKHSLSIFILIISFWSCAPGWTRFQGEAISSSVLYSITCRILLLSMCSLNYLLQLYIPSSPCALLLYIHFPLISYITKLITSGWCSPQFCYLRSLQHAQPHRNTLICYIRLCNLSTTPSLLDWWKLCIACLLLLSCRGSLPVRLPAIFVKHEDQISWLSHSLRSCW